MSTVPLGVRLPDRIGVFDAETDGVDVESCHIVTAFIGLMDTATGVIVEKWEWLLNTGHEIPQGASDVHGITTERMRAEGTDPKQGVFEITQRLDIIGRAGITMVVMNAPFDFTLLDRELLRHWPEMRPLMEPDDEGKVQRPWVFDPMTFDRAISKRGPRPIAGWPGGWRSSCCSTRSSRR
jgi:DNA polymerase-3 subunit epsilon